MSGPPFGRRFNDSKQLRLPGHTVQRFEVVEAFNLVIAACFSESDETNEQPCVLVCDMQTTKVFQKITFKPREYPSAVSWHTFDGVGESTAKLKVYIGTSLMADKANGEIESYSPQKGTLYAYDFDVELRCEQEIGLNGAVYDIQDFMLAGKSYLVLGINAIVRIYLVDRDSNMIETIAEADSQIITYKLKVVKPTKPVQRKNDCVKILVADIMKSLSVYSFARYPDPDTGDRFKIEARDPNGLWCIEMASVPNNQTAAQQANEMSDSEEDGTDDFYLTADFDQNLTLLQKFRNVDPKKADLLQIKASAFMGQQVTQIG